MESTNSLFLYLNKFVPVSKEEFREWLAPYLIIRKFDKKAIVTKLGEIENYFNFIISGLVRKYYKKGKEEINTQISHQNHIIHAQESFHSRQPSEYTIETIEPTVMVSITYDDLEKANAKSQKMEYVSRMIITNALVIKDNWQMQMIKMTPRERFIHFIQRNPELVRRVPQKFLASFLNIKPETFSRFKHLIREHSRVKNLEVH
jgi:CRP-like cAMP-binding protein